MTRAPRTPEEIEAALQWKRDNDGLKPEDEEAVRNGFDLMIQWEIEKELEIQRRELKRKEKRGQ